MSQADMNPNVAIESNGTSFPLQNQLIHSAEEAQPSESENLLALGSTPSTMPSFPIGGTSNLLPYREFDPNPEDELRVRSHEMLETEDMQHLLRMFSMGGHGHSSFNPHENTYPYSAYTPAMPSNFGFEEARTRTSGKAVVGWLKLKAALRWGIFIRKQAAQRRAQIVELDDF